MKIDQLLAGFADGDAISHAALALHEVFLRWGIESNIYAVSDHVSPSLRSQCKPLSEYQGHAEDVVLHHYSIGSPALEAFTSSPARKILMYHNVTPAEFFEGFDDRVAKEVHNARVRLKDVGSRADAIWAVSRFNALELEASGLRNVNVFQLLFSRQQLDLPPDPEVLKKFASPLKTILFVGRLAPNKKVETLIEAFYWYNKTINPFSRLVIIGSERSCPRYFSMLRMMVGDLDLPNVCFEGFASPAGLPAYYQSADVFVATSEHEGYCLPLVEAMYMKVPVIARATGGMPEALNGAGVMFDDLKTSELAALIDRVITDSALRGEILDSQRKRMEVILKRDVESELKNLLKDFMPREVVAR